MTTHYIKEYIEKRIHNAKEMLTQTYGDEIPKEYTDLLELVSKANIYDDSYHKYIKSRLNNIANQYKKLKPNDTLTDLFFGDNAITERLEYVRTPQSKYDVYREVRFAELENRRINLSGWNLKGVSLYQSNLTKANLQYTNLFGAYVYGLTLTETDLSNANLEKSVFQFSKGTSTNFKNSNMNGVKLENCTFHKAKLLNTKLQCATIHGTHLKESTFTKTSFNGSKIRYVNFRGTTFNDTTMRHCELDLVDFVNVKLNDTDFDHSTINFLPDDPDNPDNTGEVDFRRVSLSNTNSDKPTQDKISLGNVKDVKSYAEAIHSVDKDKDPFNRDIHGIIAAHIHKHGDGILKEHMNSLEIEESKKSSRSPKKSNNTLPFMNNSRTNKNESKQTPDEQLNM